MNKKTILITGAASGIGREAALLFAQKGWFVGIFDINEKGLKDLESEIGKSDCFLGIMDISDPVSVQNGMDWFCGKTGGKLNVLLNNAGIIKFGHFENVDLEMHQKLVNVNLLGSLNCIYLGLKYLKQTPGSRIINLSSASSIYGVPDFAVYSATKHAISAMTEALNIELEKYGIFVCDIKPPYVKTPLLDVPEEIYSKKVMGVFMGPEQVAKAIWKAAHRKKLHWNIGSTFFLVIFFWLLPFTRQFIVKSLTIPRK